MATLHLYEIRVLVACETVEEGELVEQQIGDVLANSYPPERFGTVFYEGVSQNGTEVPEGWDSEEAPFAEAKLSASGHKTEDDDVQGAPI
jgi:hypothetical protein